MAEGGDVGREGDKWEGHLAKWPMRLVENVDIQTTPSVKGGLAR